MHLTPVPFPEKVALRAPQIHRFRAMNFVRYAHREGVPQQIPDIQRSTLSRPPAFERVSDE